MTTLKSLLPTNLSEIAYDDASSWISSYDIHINKSRLKRIHSVYHIAKDLNYLIVQNPKKGGYYYEIRALGFVNVKGQPMLQYWDLNDPTEKETMPLDAEILKSGNVAVYEIMEPKKK